MSPKKTYTSLTTVHMQSIKYCQLGGEVAYCTMMLEKDSKIQILTIWDILCKSVSFCCWCI